MDLRVDLDNCELQILSGFIGYLENNNITHFLDSTQHYMMVEVDLKDYSMRVFKEWVSKLGPFISMKRDSMCITYIPLINDPTILEIIHDWKLEMRDGVSYVWKGNTELGEFTDDARFYPGFGDALVETNNTMPWRIRNIISLGYSTKELIFSIMDEFEKPF